MWRALQGSILGCGAPIGWAFIVFIRGLNPADDFTANPVLYFYMFFGTATAFAIFGGYFGLQESQLRERSWRDHLTSLYNLRYFREQLDIQLAQCVRDEVPLTLIYFDIDHFKKVNDTYGHAAGDTVLIELSKMIGRILRKNELFARIGGEEFAIFMPRSNVKTGSRLAERIREIIAGHAIPINAKTSLTVTISMGVVETQPDETATSFIERADSAMYQAKKTGRNKVVVV
tara:strand:- start:593 stop:1285 length:693 start_codon:yes stop_codon:yes gene_type:complete